MNDAEEIRLEGGKQIDPKPQSIVSWPLMGEVTALRPTWLPGS